mmetsp:Transcript_10852/g.38066  ORF Transcript_10852/g.38066 Transcript_10852/m.38066 type:complete len:438 (-) Transcript_10852:525-1838(-)
MPGRRQRCLFSAWRAVSRHNRPKISAASAVSVSRPVAPVWSPLESRCSNASNKPGALPAAFCNSGSSVTSEASIRRVARATASPGRASFSTPTHCFADSPAASKSFTSREASAKLCITLHASTTRLASPGCRPTATKAMSATPMRVKMRAKPPPFSEKAGTPSSPSPTATATAAAASPPSVSVAAKRAKPYLCKAWHPMYSCMTPTMVSATVLVSAILGTSGNTTDNACKDDVQTSTLSRCRVRTTSANSGTSRSTAASGAAGAASLLAKTRSDFETTSSLTPMPARSASNASQTESASRCKAATRLCTAAATCRSAIWNSSCSRCRAANPRDAPAFRCFSAPPLDDGTSMSTPAPAHRVGPSPCASRKTPSASTTSIGFAASAVPPRPTPHGLSTSSPTSGCRSSVTTNALVGPALSTALSMAFSTSNPEVSCPRP